MKKNLFTLIIFLAYSFCLYAQDTRTEKISVIKKELNAFLAAKKGQKHTSEIEQKIQTQLNQQEPGHMVTAAQKKAQYEELSAFFWENQFWKTHPDYETFVSQRHIGNGANLCANGGFEFGNNAFTHFGSSFNAGGSDNCAFAGTIPFNPTIATDPTADVANRMQLVGAGDDPFVVGLKRTHTGGRALRINANVTATGGSCSGYGKQIDKAATTFVLDAQTSFLSFWFAVVMQDPDHNDGGGGNPFFTARVRNHTTGAVLTVCLDPSQNNLQNAGVDCSDSVKWQGWRCGTFDMRQWAIGTTVTLEFIAADCNAGGHYGYAYIDDICAGCNITGSNGSVTIATNDSCYTDGVRFNGTFTLPTTQGSTLQSIVVELRQNGVAIASIPVTISGTTFSGTVPAGLLTNGGAYDLVAIATFNVPGQGPAIAVNEVQQGINNDFRATTIGCCDQTDTPNFTIQTSCNNGVLTVTVTATDPNPPNHWWGLMQTSVAGQTTDAVTLNGGLPIAPVQGGPSATFTITDFSKSYYIKHGIWQPGCYDWREMRIPINLPQSDVNFIIIDSAKKIKDTFCFGEPVSMYAYSLLPTTSYYIDVWRRPINSTPSTPFSWYSGLGWTTGSPGLINLSTAFAGLTPPVYFEPNYEYEVKLAVSNPNLCIGWTEVKKRFKVICCNDFFKGDFLIKVDPSPTSYAISAIGFDTYALAGAVHEWYVLSSPNQFGGPYTPVTSLTSTTQTTVPLFNNAQYGLFYTVIHKIRTRCGEICIARTQYQSGLGRGTDATISTQSQVDCCLAFQFWPNGAGTPPADFTAEFELGSTPNGDGTYTIDIYPGSTYSNNPSVTHEWYVFTSPNPTGGPYTQVGQGSGTNYDFTPATPGLYYFVIHRVKSPCGEVCFGQSICRNCEKRESGGCELCGPIDCSVLDKLLKNCTVPTGLFASCERQVMVWNPVPSAVTYSIEVSFNDPACCRSSYLPSGFLWNDLTSPSLPFSAFSTVRYDCFRWRVKANCADGESDWSAWQCFSCTKDGEGQTDGTSLSTPKRTAVTDGKTSDKLQPQIAPNPNNGDMVLSMRAPGDLVLSAEVFNAQGVRVTTIARNTYRGGQFTYKLSLGQKAGKGIYTVVFTTNYGTFHKKVVVH